MKNTLSTVSKLIAIAIGDRKATIKIAIGDFFLNGDRDRDSDLKFDQDRDRDRDRNFRDRGHALSLSCLLKICLVSNKDMFYWGNKKLLAQKMTCSILVSVYTHLSFYSAIFLSSFCGFLIHFRPRPIASNLQKIFCIFQPEILNIMFTLRKTN